MMSMNEAIQAGVSVAPLSKPEQIVNSIKNVHGVLSHIKILSTKIGASGVESSPECETKAITPTLIDVLSLTPNELNQIVDECHSLLDNLESKLLG